MNQHSRTSASANDGRISAFIIFPALLVLITVVVTVIYYINRPQPGVGPDSLEYLDLAQRIAAHGQLVDPHRLPGFPLLITIIFALTHQGNLQGVGVANAVLFIGSAIEIYFVTWLLTKQAWAAFVIGLLVGSNLVLLALVDAIAPESMAIFFLTSIALASVLMIQRRKIRYLWLVATCLAGLFFTRGEWAFLPLPLFAYLVLTVVRKGEMWRYVINGLVAVILLNALLGAYIYVNATQNHYVGTTDISNINLWGKVIQYQMQNEGPARYARIAQITDNYVTHKNNNDPYDLIKRYPEVKANHYEAVGAYSRAIILGHPVEFVVKSVRVVFYPWPYFYYQRNADAQATFGKILLQLQAIDHDIYRVNIVFPLCLVVWLFLLCWRRTTMLSLIRSSGAPILIVVYGILVITAFGYDSYTRLHAPFTPLMTLIIWGSLGMGVWQLLPARWRGRIGVNDEPALAIQGNSAAAWQGLRQANSIPDWRQEPQTLSTPAWQQQAKMASQVGWQQISQTPSSSAWWQVPQTPNAPAWQQVPQTPGLPGWQQGLLTADEGTGQGSLEMVGMVDRSTEMIPLVAENAEHTRLNIPHQQFMRTGSGSLSESFMPPQTPISEATIQDEADIEDRVTVVDQMAVQDQAIIRRKRAGTLPLRKTKLVGE